MREVGVLIGDDEAPIFWHVPQDRSVVCLPDSRDLWDVIWENRDIVSGFAHTHPGSGTPGPSHEDLSTFYAVEKALGRVLNWWILTRDEAVRVGRDVVGVKMGKSCLGRVEYKGAVYMVRRVSSYWLSDNEEWIETLRAESKYGE